MSSVLKLIKDIQDDLLRPMDKIFTKAAEKFNFSLVEGGLNHKETILLICNTFDVSLEVAEKIVDNAPIVLKENITKTEADSLKEKFESVGATVELKKL